MPITPAKGIVRGIWDGMQRLGFEGGRILEPGMGAGHFPTAAPAGVMRTSSYTGIELDAFTSPHSEAALPQENVDRRRFHQAEVPRWILRHCDWQPAVRRTRRS
jgi:hypothetical protein